MRGWVEATGLKEFIDDVEKFRERLEKPMQLARKTAILLRHCFAQNFNMEGRPEKWQALAPSTLADKQRLFDAGMIRGRRLGVLVRRGPDGEERGHLPGILMRTGALKESLAHAHSRGNIERFLNDGKELEVGSQFGKVHNEGGTKSYAINPVKAKVLCWYGIDRRTGQPGWIFARSVRHHPPIPKREFLVVTEETWQQIREAANDYMMGGIDGSASNSSDS